MQLFIPGLRFNVIEACHCIYMGCAFSVSTGLWVLLCRRNENKGKDKSAVILPSFSSKYAVWWWGSLNNKKIDQRGNILSSWLWLSPIAQMIIFRFLEWTSSQAGDVVTHNDLNETLNPLVWAVWITRGWRFCGGGQLCLCIGQNLRIKGYSPTRN